jgi:hypothetical protein
MIYGLLLIDGGAPQMCFLGDKWQSIYKFNDADSRFLTLASELLPGEWGCTILSKSYRLHSGNARFVNACVGYKRIIPYKDGPMPTYVVAPPFNAKASAKFITQFMLDHKYDPSDVFVLSPSIKSKKSPIRLIANILSNNGIPIFVPVSDDENVDKKVLVEKMSFISFHQVKGLEKKCVFVFGVEDNYFTFFERDQSGEKCTNALYVAMTRAQEHMVIFQANNSHPMKFIKPEYCNCITIGKPGKAKKSTRKTKSAEVTSLTRHVPNRIIKQALQCLKITTIHEADNSVDIKRIIQQGSQFESVSEITGVAIPAYCEKKLTNSMSIGECDDSIEGLLQLSTKYCAKRSGYTFKVNQIKTYDWISMNNLVSASNMLRNRLGINGLYHGLLPEFEVRLASSNVIGFADIVYMKKIWELKCVGMLRPEHILQLAAYEWLGQIYDGYVLNLLTGEQIRVQANSEDLNMLFDILIDYNDLNSSDCEFVAMNKFVEINPAVVLADLDEETCSDWD